MDKKPLSESDICDKFIRPAMEAAGWNGMDQIYRDFPLRAGRVVVSGQNSFRDKTTVVRADYAVESPRLRTWFLSCSFPCMFNAGTRAPTIADQHGRIHATRSNIRP